MSRSLLQSLEPGRLLLIQLQSLGNFRFNEQTVSDLVEGELALQVGEIARDGVQVSVAWLGLSSLGGEDRAWKEEIGRLSVGAISAGRGTLHETRDGLGLDLAFGAGLSRSAALAVRDASRTDGDVGPSPRDPYRVEVEATITGEPGAKNWRCTTNSFVFTPSPDSSARLGRWTLDAEGNVLRVLDRRPRRRLTVRCVQLSAQKNCSDSTGLLWGDQLAAAQPIWNECGIEVTAHPEPLHLIEGELMVTSDVNAVYTRLKGLRRVIDVAFVRSELAEKGGGYTFGGGTANAAVVLSDVAAAKNPNLLAHELGHVLNLCHPSCFKTGFAVSESDTVMVDESPNNARNSPTNCNGVLNDALISIV